MKQLSIVVAALGIVALWLLLWQVLESDEPRVGNVTPSESAPRSDTLWSEPTSDPVEEGRESLGSPAPPGVSEAPTPEPPPGPSLRLLGAITDERDRAPVAAVSLKLVDSGWEVKTARSDGSGEYGFEGLHPGTWELSIEAPGYRSTRVGLELTSEEPDRRLDLVLPPGEVVKLRLLGDKGLDLRGFPWRGRAGLGMESAWLEPVVTVEEPAGWVGGGARVGGTEAGVFVERERPARPPAANRVDDEDPLRLRVRLPDGSRIDDLPPAYVGAFVLSRPPPVFASLVVRGYALQTRPVVPGADEVTFGFTKEDYDEIAGELRLRVVDGDTEAPPSSLKVLLGERLAGRRGSRVEADGTVVFQEVLAGSAILTITADEREAVNERVPVRPGTVTDLGVYRLQPLARIRVRVVDDAGEPAQVMFNVFPFDRYAATRETLAKRIFRSNPDGELTIDSAGRGRYLILANDAGWVSMPAVADTTLGDVEDLEIRVSKGTRVAVRLRADPLPAARLEIRTRSGLPVAERFCRDRDPMEFLLVPGAYSIELWDGETWLASETLTVGTEPERLYFPR